MTMKNGWGCTVEEAEAFAFDILKMCTDRRNKNEGNKQQMPTWEELGKSW